MGFKTDFIGKLEEFYKENEVPYVIDEGRKDQTFINMIHEEMSPNGNQGLSVLFFNGKNEDEGEFNLETKEADFDAPRAHFFNIVIHFGTDIPVERVPDIAAGLNHINPLLPGGFFFISDDGLVLAYRYGIFLYEKYSLEDAVGAVDNIHSIAYFNCSRFMDTILTLAEETITLEEFKEEVKKLFEADFSA